MQYKLNKGSKLNPMQILSLGFLAVILIGGILLSLPISSASGEYTNFIDAIFTSTSAVCVTGLITVDTGTHWNLFGQTVIMMLIEIGGLGFMSFTTLIAILLGKKITLRERLILQNAMNTFNIQGVVKMVKYILLFTISIQFVGTLIFCTQLVPEYGLSKGLFYSIFHSISAFCNAGFDVFGNGVSLTTHNTNIIVILTAAALIIIGGLGFGVWTELYNVRRIKRFSLHAKIVLLVTGFLLIAGTILMLLFEYNNAETIGFMNIKEKVLNSFFAVVTPRTAGFNSISTSGMSSPGKFLTMILMMIGGSPGSTAGGIKTTTVGVLILTVICVIKRREDTEAFSRRISKDVVYKAFTLFFIGSGLVIVVSLILSFSEAEASFTAILYETISAFSTAGLSIGLTPDLSGPGKVLIMMMMYIGRVGPLTVLLSLTKEKVKSGIRYPEGKILIG